MNAKAVAVMLLLGAAVAAADASPTVAVALENRADTVHFWQSLSLYPDIQERVGKEFIGTLLVPTNEAWDATMGKVLPLNSAELKEIILYHIIPGPPAPITGINDNQIFLTAADKIITAQYADGKLTFDGIGSDAHVVKPDITIGPAGYGVVHIIDNVLLPAKPAAPKPAKDTVKATSIADDIAGTVSSAAAGASSATATAVDATEAAVHTATDAGKNTTGTDTGLVTPCPANYDPVCGQGNVTYGNECVANGAKAAIDCKGECPCPGAPKPCTKEHVPVCGANNATYANKCLAGEDEIVCDGECPCDVKAIEETGPRPCPLNYLPVCGTNGKTYGNECAANADMQDIECEGKCPCTAPLIAGAPSLAPSAGPPTARSPTVAPSPEVAPEPMSVPLSSAAAASVRYVAVALLSMLLLLS